MRVFLILILILVVISACKLDINVQLYTRDVVDFSNGKLESEYAFVPATVRIEMSKSSFEDKKEKIQKILQRYFINPENLRYEAEDYGGYAVVEVEIPFLEDYTPSEKSLVGFVARKRDDGSYEVGIVVNGESFEELKSVVSDEFFTSIDVKDIDLHIDVNNDMRKDNDVEVFSVYVNGKAVLYPQKFTIKRRKSIKIDVSNVMKDYLFESGEVRGMMKIEVAE